MRAVVDATGRWGTADRCGNRPPVTTMLVDRPFIQHVVEFLLDGGIRRVDFILNEDPRLVEDHFGDGTRWGGEFHYHLVRDPKSSPQVLRRMGEGTEGGPVLLATADCLPLLEGTEFEAGRVVRSPRIYLASVPEASTPGVGGEARPRIDWTGWGWLPLGLLADAPADAFPRGLYAWLAGVAGTDGAVQVPPPLGIRDHAELLASQRRVLNGSVRELVRTGRETRPGIRIGWNASVHRSAVLTAPVSIGENAHIGSGVRLGPNVAVGRDCIVDANSIVKNSVVLPGTYVGRSLEITDSLVDRQRIVNTRLGAEFAVPDHLLLGAASLPRLADVLYRIGERVIAAVLLLLGAPALLLVALYLKATRVGPVLHARDVVRTPVAAFAGSERLVRLWTFHPRYGAARFASRTGGGSDLLLRVLPGLFGVVKGHISLVGVEPRPPEAVAGLPEDWKVLYGKARAGLITEAEVVFGPSPDPEELFSAEAYYSVTRSVRRDVVLLLKYLRRDALGNRGREYPSPILSEDSRLPSPAAF